MATALVPNLEECGTIQRPRSNCLFPVQDASVVWIVQRGKIDLFLVSGQSERLGSRYHILRVEESQAVFGIARFSNEVSLVATTLPGTILLRVARASFCDLISQGDHRCLRLLEDWVSRIGAALSKSADAGACIAIEAGDTVAIGEDSKAIIPKQQVSWVAQLKGESRFLGLIGLPGVQGSSIFPISRHGWLLASTGSEIQAVDPSLSSRADALWRGLQDFHALAISCFVENRRCYLEQVQKRAEMRDASDSASLRNTVMRLAAPLSMRSAVSDSDEICPDRVFLACEMLGKRMGIRMKPSPDMLRGLPVADPVADVAKTSGIRWRRVMLKGQWWKQDIGPLLGFQGEDNKPVAILPASSRKINVFDPIEKRTVPLTDEIAALMRPFAYAFYRPFPAAKLNVFDLLRFGLRDCQRECGTILFTGIAMGSLAIILPYATGVAFDVLIPGADRTQLAHTCALLLIIAVASAILWYSRGLAVLRLEGRMSAAIQSAVWDRLLALPVSFFRDYSAGDLAQRSMGIEQIRQILTANALRAVLSAIFSAFSLMLLFYYSLQLALVATCLLMVACAATLVWTHAQVQQQRELFKLQGQISGKLLQFISGVAKLRVSGTENRAFAAWARLFSRQKIASTRGRHIANRLTVFNSVFSLVSFGVLFYFHGLVMSPSPLSSARMTTGQFLGFLTAFTQCIVAALTLNSTIVSSAKIVPVYERAKPILHATPEVTVAKAHPGNLTGDVEISHVTFRYGPGSQPILRDVSLKISPGQFVAVVGPSGSGKSTLFRLLLGFETAESGAIYYDGQDLAGLDVQSVRQQLGVVLQSSRPIGGSLFENIIGSAPLTLNDAWEAARMAGLEEDIRRMPMGMHTFLAMGGDGISGGQRQRLLIARAIVSRPRIFLFDEATSALDNRTQEIVSRNLENLRATRIVIAHRLSTILHADRIFVLDHGVIVQSGSYQELLEQDGLFRDLATRQLT